MFQVDLDVAEAFAPSLTITHQVTGNLQPLVLTKGQMLVLRAIVACARVIVLKSRQVYISTACCLYAVLFASINPGIKVALVADVKEKAEGLLQKAAEWASACGFVGHVECTAEDEIENTKRLVLWNGAEIHAVTANSKHAGSKQVKSGRSFSYGLIILSEFAYYDRDSELLTALTRSALAGARIVIESTATPAENAFRSIWERGKGWEKVFLSFEQHEAYQAPADSIDDATWEMLRDTYSFTSRTHAAYWWQMVQTDFNGDVNGGLREGPILPEHAFAFAEGRWIFRFEESDALRFELGYVFAPDVPGGWRIYDDVDESGCIFGVDTASGVGADASTIVIIGRKRGNLIATFCARDIKVPDFIAVVKAAAERWKPRATVIEGNGIGKGVYQALSMLPVARAQEHTSTDAEKPIRMNLVKLAIESGQMGAGPELEHEVKHSVMLRPRRNKGAPIWDGPDDLLNAAGFALVWRRDNPWRASSVPIDPRTHVDRRTYRQRKKSRKVF